MENKSITFTIPLIPSLLRAMADMLNRMANGEGYEDPEFKIADTEEEASEVAETYTPDESSDLAPTPPTTDSPAPPTPGPELDAGGIPWDTRIHSSGKTFYESGARKGTWKRKRGVAPETVVQVEHELKSAMAAPAQKADDITEAEKAFGPVGDTPPPPATGVPAPPTDPNCEGCSRFPAECEACKAASAAPMAITTFAELNHAITVKGITIEAANAAALKHGLPSYAVLHARADLIPAVAKELGL